MELEKILKLLKVLFWVVLALFILSLISLFNHPCWLAGFNVGLFLALLQTIHLQIRDVKWTIIQHEAMDKQWDIIFEQTGVIIKQQKLIYKLTGGKNGKNTRNSRTSK